MNWILVARVLTGFQDVVLHSDHGPEHYYIQRAARSCRDRWQRLARKDPTMARDVREAERKHREKFTSDFTQMLEGGDRGRRVSLSRRVFLLPSSADGATGEKVASPGKEGTDDAAAKSMDPSVAKSSEAPQEAAALQSRPKRSFSAFYKAKTKKQVIPITIPGVPSGSPPSVVPSHASHLQSVQQSVSASWTSGLTDMWPLQLLDAADRQRAAVAAAQGSSNGIHVPSSSRVGSSHRGSSSYPTSNSLAVPPQPSLLRQSSGTAQSFAPPQRAPPTGSANASIADRPPPNA
jgi:hypothetical protein